MKLRTALKDLGYLAQKDLEIIQNEVMNADRSEWLANTKRQRFWDAHKDTESIILKMGPEYESSEFTDAWKLKWSKIFKHTFIKAIKEIYGEGEITRMVISKLKPGGCIGEHRDTERLLHFSHRIHLPIITDEQVQFFISNDSYFLEQGKIYEISNQDPHRVESQSDKDRIHIILDYADSSCLHILKNY